MTFHVEPFTTEELFQWEDYDLPADEERATKLWRQMKADVLAAATAIEERDVKIAQQAAEIVSLRGRTP